MKFKKMLSSMVLLCLFSCSMINGNNKNFIESDFCKKWICIEEKREAEDTSGYKASAANIQYTYAMNKIPDAKLVYQEFNNGAPPNYYFLHNSIDFRFINVEYISDLIKTVLGESASYDVKQNCEPKVISVTGNEEVRFEGEAKEIKFLSGFYKIWCGYFVRNDAKTKKLIYDNFYFFLTWDTIHR
jgi:hypothetical protein